MTDIVLSQNFGDYQDLLCDVLLFEHQTEGLGTVAESLTLVDRLTEQLSGYMYEQGYQQDQPLGLDQLNDVLDSFYLDLAFSSTTQDVPESVLNSLCYVVRYHTGEAISMSILLNHLLNRLGFECATVVIDHELMLKVDLSKHLFVVVDAITGEQHTHKVKPSESILPELDGLQYRGVDKLSMLQIYLTQQKMAYTQELQYDKALQCIEMLIKSMPDDPYQRRDRGFILHQLDCFEHARDDFEFFIDQCPEDPAAQLLKLQLEEFVGRNYTVH